MKRVTALISQYFASRQGVLWVGGVSIRDIAQQHGTPLFVYDSSVLSQKIEQLRRALPSRFTVCYSVKANPSRRVLEFFVAHGCGLEIASAGELYQALASGCRPEKVIFAGPGKTEAELEMALVRDIGEIHAESRREIERIGRLCRCLGVRGRVALRVNPTGEAQGGAMRMGGKPSPFGIDEERVGEVLQQVLSEDFIEFRGIHLFAGTQVLDYSVLVNQYRKGVELARRVADQLGRPLRTLDFGGGLGIPYFPGEEALDLDSLRKELEVLMDEIRVDPRLAGTELMVEPGRFLVGESGVYVARINDIKTSRGKKFLILDGGMNHHLAASGNLGQVIKKNYPVAIVSRLDLAPSERVDIVGPLCTPLDTLARDVELPAAEVGDLVGVFQSGAYGRTASPTGFLSHPTPPEVWVEAGRAMLIKTRGDYEG